jgi:hypothetical protein
MNMKDLLFTLYILSALAFFSCKNTPGNNQNSSESNALTLDSQYAEVMRIHDEAMPRMGQVNDLKRQLQQQLSGLDSTSATWDSVVYFVDKLEEADEGMFEWMAAFKDPRKKLEEEKARAYLEAELVKVGKVADDIDQSIEEGMRYLNKIETK